MTILEATVEITKSAIASANGNADYLITVEDTRKKFLTGIEALYKKLEELDANYLKK